MSTPLPVNTSTPEIPPGASPTINTIYKQRPMIKVCMQVSIVCQEITIV